MDRYWLRSMNTSARNFLRRTPRGSTEGTAVVSLWNGSLAGEPCSEKAPTHAQACLVTFSKLVPNKLKEK